MAFFNQALGNNASIYDAFRIFVMAGLGKISGLLSSASIRLINFLFTILTLNLTEWFGRLTLMLIWSFGIILTRGEKGGSIISGEGSADHQGYKVEVEDTIGNGNSFLATFLSHYLQNQPTAGCLKKACLVGAYVASCKGTTPLYNPHQLEASFAGNAS